MPITTHSEKRNSFVTNPMPRDPCEFNPDEKRAAHAHEVHARAEFIIGANGKWRVCGQCAQNAFFSKFKRRTAILRNSLTR